METNTAFLLDLFQDISSCFDQMPPAELRAFAQHWHELSAYLTQDATPTQAAFVAQLQQAIAASPVLKQEGFDKLVGQELDKTRFAPSLATVTHPTAQAGLAPVRNEVVLAVYQVGQHLQQHISKTAA